MYKWPKLFLSLSLFTLLTPNPSKALDNIYTATRTPEGFNFIRIFNNNGALQGDIRINDSFKDAQFIAGKWIPNENSIIAVIQSQEKPKKTTAYILNSAGNVKKTIPLGNNVLKVIGLDYNDNGIQDLAVQKAKEKKVTVYLDPATGKATESFSLSKKASDVISTLTSEKTGLAELVLQNTNRNFLDDKTKPAKLNKNKNYIQYKQKKRKATLKFQTTLQRIFPLKISGSSEPAFIAQRNALKLKVLGKNVKQTELEKNEADKLFTGLFSSETQSDIAIGQPLDPKTGIAIVRFINPTTLEERQVELDFNFNSSANMGYVDFCSELYNLINNYSSFSYYYEDKESCTKVKNKKGVRCQRIAQELILKLKTYKECYYYDYYKKQIQTIRQKDRRNDAPVFYNNAVTFLSNVAVFGSNTGTARIDKCSELFLFNKKKGSFDGYKNGFTVKNSDTGRIEVPILTHDEYYKNGRLLHASTYKKLYSPYRIDPYGDRIIHRFSGLRLPFKRNYIFAADTFGGETGCWLIPKGYRRID